MGFEFEVLGFPLQRKVQIYGSAFSLFGMYFDPAFVFLDDTVCDGQAEPGSLAHLTGGKEGLEYFGLDRFGDAATVIAKTDQDLTLKYTRLDVQFAGGLAFLPAMFGFDCLAGINDQI